MNSEFGVIRVWTRNYEKLYVSLIVKWDFLADRSVQNCKNEQESVNKMQNFCTFDSKVDNVQT